MSLLSVLRREEGRLFVAKLAAAVPVARETAGPAIAKTPVGQLRRATATPTSVDPRGDVLIANVLAICSLPAHAN